MIDLSSLILRLETQFLNQHQLALPDSLKTEAMRASLSELNSILGTNYTLIGLDGASQSTLLEAHLPALMKGAAATVLEAVAFHNHSSYSNLPAAQPDLETWSRSLRQERDQFLEHLRLRTFSQANSIPWGTWTLEEPVSYD
jgi:hypothetical protein